MSDTNKKQTKTKANKSGKKRQSAIPDAAKQPQDFPKRWKYCFVEGLVVGADSTYLGFYNFERKKRKREIFLIGRQECVYGFAADDVLKKKYGKDVEFFLDFQLFKKETGLELSDLEELVDKDRLEQVVFHCTQQDLDETLNSLAATVLSDYNSGDFNFYWMRKYLEEIIAGKESDYFIKYAGYKHFYCDIRSKILDDLVGDMKKHIYIHVSKDAPFPPEVYVRIKHAAEDLGAEYGLESFLIQEKQRERKEQNARKRIDFRRELADVFLMNTETKEADSE